MFSELDIQEYKTKTKMKYQKSSNQIKTESSSTKNKSIPATRRNATVIYS